MEYALEVALIMPQISHLIIVLILVLMEYALEVGIMPKDSDEVAKS